MFLNPRKTEGTQTCNRTLSSPTLGTFHPRLQWPRWLYLTFTTAPFLGAKNDFRVPIILLPQNHLSLHRPPNARMSLRNSSGRWGAEFSQWWASSNDKLQEEMNTSSCWDSHTVSIAGLCHHPCVGSSRHYTESLSAARGSSATAWTRRFTDTITVHLCNHPQNECSVFTASRKADFLNARPWLAKGSGGQHFLHTCTQATTRHSLLGHLHQSVPLIQKHWKSNLEDHPDNIHCLKDRLPYSTTKSHKINLLLLWELWKLYGFSPGMCGKTGSRSMPATASQGGVSVELELKFCGLGNKTRGTDHMGPVLLRNTGELLKQNKTTKQTNKKKPHLLDPSLCLPHQWFGIGSYDLRPGRCMNGSGNNSGMICSSLHAFLGICTYPFNTVNIQCQEGLVTYSYTSVLSL